MKILRNLVLLLGLLPAMLAHAEGQLTVADPWVREAPPGAMALAGYMQLHNHGENERVLVGAASPEFESVMLHRTVLEDGVSKMVHQHMIVIPAKGMLSFEPNSYHLMMMNPQQPLKAGDTVHVTLRFKNGETQKLNFKVRAVMGEMGHGHQ